MRFRILLLGFIGFLFFIDSNAQLSCAISNIDDAASSYPTNELSKARLSTFRIAINPVIVHPENGTEIFTENDLNEIIDKANEYFQAINYEFYVLENGIKHVYSDKYAKLSIDDENELRSSYDELTAINLYLVSEIHLENGDKLSGYTSLPTLSNRGNRIFLSYFDRNFEDFLTLKQKVFPHELGHYFGLLHTFQNSASEVIADRELVTRDVGANCSTTGDFLCDTPADPFERLNTLASLSCNSALPDTLVDSLGFNFNPLQDNLMSYQIRCGNSFTPQQYRRMQAVGSIRFSASAEYQIIQQAQNTISIGKLPKKSYCTGEIVEFDWSSNGNYGNENKFTFEIGDGNSEGFQRINTFSLGDKTSLTIPDSLPAGKDYRIRITASNPYTESYLSESFEVRTVGDYNLSLDKNAINQGDAIELNVSFSGSGPWDWELNNGTKVNQSFNRSQTIKLFPTSDFEFQLKNASGACGSISNGNSVQLFVVKPQISILSTENLIFCENQKVALIVNGLRNTDNYKVRIIGNEEFMVSPTIRDNTLTFELPTALKSRESNYGFEILGSNLGDYSPKYSFKLNPSPAKPEVVSPIEVCFNQKNVSLQATGQGLKWYESSFTTTYTVEQVVETSKAGLSNFYVTQSNEFNCESPKSQIDVEVKPPLSVSISGDAEIMIGDSTGLRIQVDGEVPVQVVLNDGTTLNLTSNTEFYFVNPSSSFIYEIAEAKNACGVGLVTGDANITVQFPLNFQELSAKDELIVYPNPSNDKNVYVKPSQTKRITQIRAFNQNGKELGIERTSEHMFQLLNSGFQVLNVSYSDGTWENKKIVVYK